MIRIFINKKKENWKRIFFLILKFYEITEKECYDIIKEGTDKEIYEKLEKYKIKYRDKNKGSEYKSKEIVEWIKKIKDIKEIEKYLDVGCNNGIITEKIMRKLEKKKENVYGIDIEHTNNKFDNKENKKDELTFTYYNGKEIPFEDNTFDLITIFQVLHHIKNVKMIINEVYRVLKPGGIVIIKEHNLRYQEERIIYEMEHYLYGKIVDGLTYDEISLDYRRYLSKKTWDKIFILANFIPVNEVKKKVNYYYKIYKK